MESMPTGLCCRHDDDDDDGYVVLVVCLLMAYSSAIRPGTLARKNHFLNITSPWPSAISSQFFFVAPTGAAVPQCAA